MVAPTHDSADRATSPSHGSPEVSGRQPAAIGHALHVLEAVARLGPGVPAQRIAQHLGLSSATAYRLLNLLVAEEYIVRMPDLSGFALGRRALEFAGVAAPPTGLSRQARRVLAALRGAIRFGVHVFGYAHDRPYLLDADPDHPPQGGPAEDFALTAVGALVAAEEGDGALGQAEDWGRVRPDVACIAVAIRDETGRLIAAIVVTGPPARLRTHRDDLVRRAAAAAGELGELMA
jgi:DNA-binding IclR family transcriptional regulator